MSVAAVALGSVYVQQNQDVPKLPDILVKFGIQHERWQVNDVWLGGIDLKDPHHDLIHLIVGKKNMQRLDEFRTPQGTFDIIQLSSQTPNLDQLLKTFKMKHTHDEAEVRLILDGEGIFTVWIEGEQQEILVQKGSFVIIPKDSVHTFTLTESRNVKALRVFQQKDGWKPHYVD